MALFSNLKKCDDLRQYNLMYGVTDFSELEQFNMYESGYQFLKVIQIPKFIEELAKHNTAVYEPLVYNFVHIIEHEFKGLDGLDNLTSDTLEINDGISTINVIGKVTEQSAATVSMRFQEKKGSPITRFIRFYLTGIRDPKTQVKTYHGMLDYYPNGDNRDTKNALMPTAGFENEVFTFLYFVTDPTMRELEAAYMLLAAQPTEAEENIYNGEKGSIEFKEVTVSINCFPVRNNQVDIAAKSILDWMIDTQNAVRFVKNSSNYKYAKLTEITDKSGNYNTYDARYLGNERAQSSGDKNAKYDVNLKDNQQETLDLDFGKENNR